jgi:hypothetical protein
VLVLSAVLLHACGKKKNEAADGSTITIQPPSVDYNNIFLVGDIVQNYSLMLKYPDGTPVPNTILKISGGFAEPITGGVNVPRYQFYYGPNANRDPSNIPVDNGFTAQTNDNGVYEFSILIFSELTSTTGVVIPNAFTDTIYAASGTAQATTEVNVTAQ